MDEFNYLIDYLIKENNGIKLTKNPETIDEIFETYHVLVNLRQAKPVSDGIIDIETKLLQYCRNNKLSVNVENIDTINIAIPDNNLRNPDKISLWQGDITTLSIGAIVNAANSRGLGCFVPMHKCIDNQIHTYAGMKLRLECADYMNTIDNHLATGEAFITDAYNLPSSHVIHTVGPIINSSVDDNDKQLLANCYKSCLDLARKNNIRTIAFCCISTGEFRFPKQLACQIAVETVDEYLSVYGNLFDNVVFNVFTDEDVEIYERFIRTN